MTDYMHTLINICFTMVTGVVIISCFGAMLFLLLAIWNLIQDNIE